MLRADCHACRCPYQLQQHKDALIRRDALGCCHESRERSLVSMTSETQIVEIHIRIIRGSLELSSIGLGPLAPRWTAFRLLIHEPLLRPWHRRDQARGTKPKGTGAVTPQAAFLQQCTCGNTAHHIANVARPQQANRSGRCNSGAPASGAFPRNAWATSSARNVGPFDRSAYNHRPRGGSSPHPSLDPPLRHCPIGGVHHARFVLGSPNSDVTPELG